MLGKGFRKVLMKFIVLISLSAFLFLSLIIVIEHFLDPDCEDCEETGGVIV